MEEANAKERRGMTIEDAKQLCLREGCKAFTFARDGSGVWLLKKVEASRGQQGTKYDLYVAP